MKLHLFQLELNILNYGKTKINNMLEKRDHLVRMQAICSQEWQLIKIMILLSVVQMVVYKSGKEIHLIEPLIQNTPYVVMQLLYLMILY